MADLLTQTFVFRVGGKQLCLSLLTPASLALDKMTSVIWAQHEGELSKRGVASDAKGALTKDQEPSMTDSFFLTPG